MDQLPPGVDLSKIPLSPPPKGLVSNFINPPSLAPVAEVVGGLLIAIETILVLLRTCTNWKSFGKLRLEDYWTIWATILTYGYFALILLLRPLGRDEWNIPVAFISKAFYKTVFAQQMMLGSVLFFAKSSLLFLFWRFFSVDKHFRYKVYGAFVFLSLSTLSSIPMYLAVCLPTGRDPWTKASFKCQKTLVYGYWQAPASVVYDLFMIYLPASVVIRLQLKRRRKIGILLIFATGMLAVVASIIGLVYRVELAKEQAPPRKSYIVLLCILVESCVSIICCAMPAIPAIAKFIMEHPYIVSIRSRLSSGMASTSRSKSSSTTRITPRKFYSTPKPSSHDSDPYVVLADGTPATCMETHIQHIRLPETAKSLGINKSVKLEVMSNKRIDSDEFV